MLDITAETQELQVLASTGGLDASAIVGFKPFLRVF